MFFPTSEARANATSARPSTNNPRAAPPPRSQPYNAPSNKGTGKHPSVPGYKGHKSELDQYKHFVVDPTRIFDSFDSQLVPVADETVTGNRSRAAAMLDAVLGASSAASTLKGYNDVLKGVDNMIKNDLHFDLLPFDNPVRGGLVISHLMTLPAWTLQPADFPKPLWDLAQNPPDWAEPTVLMIQRKEDGRWIEDKKNGTPVLFVGGPP